MSMETYIQIEGEEMIEQELSINELVDATLETCYVEFFHLSVDLHWVDMDDVAPSPVKLGDAKCHASLSFNFLLYNF